MICNQCSAENRDDALFCAQCGAKLEKPGPVGQGRKCPGCDFANPTDATYCAHCGADLRQHHIGHQHYAKKHGSYKHEKKRYSRVETKLKWHPGLVALVLLAAVFVFIMSIELFVKKGNTPPQPALVETRSADTKVEAGVMDIASKFICSCGTCGEQPLDICTCNRAVEERQFIRNSLARGRKPEEVMIALNDTFGWIKPEFAKLVGDSTAETLAAVRSNPAKAQPEASRSLPGFTKLNVIAKQATAADRIEIFSHFQCPCGQCAVDELKDCVCRHPRGAIEVKAFVDSVISEGKYNIAQVLDMVDAKYGGRKF